MRAAYLPVLLFVVVVVPDVVVSEVPLVLFPRSLTFVGAVIPSVALIFTPGSPFVPSGLPSVPLPPTVPTGVVVFPYLSVVPEIPLLLSDEFSDAVVVLLVCVEFLVVERFVPAVALLLLRRCALVLVVDMVPSSFISCVLVVVVVDDERFVALLLTWAEAKQKDIMAPSKKRVFFIIN